MCDGMKSFRIALWLRLAGGPIRAASECLRSRSRRPSAGGWLARRRSSQNSTVKRSAMLTDFLLVLVAISYSQSPDARLESARRLKQQGTLRPALQAYEASLPGLTSGPVYAQALLELSQIALALGEYPRAIEAGSQAADTFQKQHDGAMNHWPSMLWAPANFIAASMPWHSVASNARSVWIAHSTIAKAKSHTSATSVTCIFFKANISTRSRATNSRFVVPRKHPPSLGIRADGNWSSPTSLFCTSNWAKMRRPSATTSLRWPPGRASSE
jgi:hypothetical protein